MIIETLPMTASVQTANPDTRWESVLSRDPRADGSFVYAVSTTGVYCRPTCPSRRPRRENVLFFESTAEARRAGYRACRRCRPDERQSPVVNKLERAREWIDRHQDEPAALTTLSRIAGLTTSHLQRSFTRFYGVSPREYAAARRITRLKSSLKSGASSADAVYEAGYGSPSRLYETAAGALGMAPREYRQGGRAQHIQYGVARCALGWVLVATTARGLCRVAIADSVHELETELGGEYPQARLSRDDRALKTVLAAVVELAEGRPGAALPTDLKGTVFQQQVWKALQQIPAGTTRTYAEVAASICRPSSARAVARACAANPLALVVPCHRVVPSAGGVGGYRWGKSRKSRLLAAEAKP